MHKRTILLSVSLAVLFAGSFVARTLLLNKDKLHGKPCVDTDTAGTSAPSDESKPAYTRIVSLAPSITETLFALGLGEQVVGVTRYCDYPHKAKLKNKVGGYYDPDNEAIVTLHPDLVVLFREHELTQQVLQTAGIEYLMVSHHSIGDILQSIETIGKQMGENSVAFRKAEDLTAELNRRIAAVQEKALANDPKTVMISTGRNMGTGKIEDVYITGRDGFYHEMIQLAGGENVYQGHVAFPVVSNEGILRLNPDVIFDMVPDLGERKLSKQAILAEWQKLGALRAVKTQQVHIFTEDYVVVPGPRFVQLLEKMHQVLHPNYENSVEDES
ncbi:MAG: ABC transporter substrate-binding protein [Deltaproteobacteria bacterium]|nr:ABC transporter substrate-binding protein [Deltaproteobacteria bacterium]MBN2674507.1 ABC transporter substrate-binding protein [Deltaproteobacteria bacterium]